MQRIFIAGATGTLGLPLIRKLIADGYRVTGMTRSADKRQLLENLGADPVVADALDGNAVVRAIAASQPDQIVHALTALPPAGVMRAQDLDSTNRLRTEGTANLIVAAKAASVPRIVAESFLLVYGTTSHAQPVTEDEILPGEPKGSPAQAAVTALRSLEQQLLSSGLSTAILRFGLFYGAAVPAQKAFVKQLQSGSAVYPSRAPGAMSFVHIDDAVSAVVAAIRQPSASGVFNIAGEEAAPFEMLLRALAQHHGTKPPRGLPQWLVRLVAPLPATFSQIRLALDTGKARRELGWSPRYPRLSEGVQR